MSILSRIEKVLTLILNFLAAIDTIDPESIPPLKQNANGTSDLNLILILLNNKSCAFSISSDSFLN